MNAIPTLYAGIRFRSRLEATWAAFFDLCRWPWTYEPIDLDGYIPDFVLRFPHQPVLAEVKPLLPGHDDAQDTKAKIEQALWQGDALILGVDVFDGGQNDEAIGWLGEYFENGGGVLAWSNAIVASCPEAHGLGLYSQEMSFHCRVCGWYDGYIPSDDHPIIRNLMAKARNRTQWNHR